MFLSVQTAMRDSLKVDGDNTFPLGHMNKKKLRKMGMLPVSVKVDADLIARGREIIDNPKWMEEEKEKARLKSLEQPQQGVQRSLEQELLAVVTTTTTTTTTTTAAVPVLGEQSMNI